MPFHRREKATTSCNYVEKIEETWIQVQVLLSLAFWKALDWKSHIGFTTKATTKNMIMMYIEKESPRWRQSARRLIRLIGNQLIAKITTCNCKNTINNGMILFLFLICSFCSIGGLFISSPPLWVSFRLLTVSPTYLYRQLMKIWWY